MLGPTFLVRCVTNLDGRHVGMTRALCIGDLFVINVTVIEMENVRFGLVIGIGFDWLKVFK